MNPFDQKPTKSLEDMMLDWKDLSPRPYKKLETDPYTKARIILMNGIEVEAVMFGHNFNRNCEDNDLRRDLALMRRIEAGQQKHVNWLSPSDETPLETTIGYEQLAVDLTAWLAMHEPDAYAKSCMDFALLEDFDHLYRYANLLKVDEDLPAHELVLDTIEITPGRPTVAHHRHPFDSVRAPRNAKTADIRTILGALILTAGEQQTMNLHEPGQHAARKASRATSTWKSAWSRKSTSRTTARCSTLRPPGCRTCFCASTWRRTCTIRSTRPRSTRT